MPQTPFTQRDFHERRQRSAAPTPDTAAPGRKFSFAWRHGEGGDDENEDEAMDMTSHPSQRAEEHSDPNHASPTPQEKGNRKGKTFEETFWEKRGEFNRAWKKRRRETGKERKQRENKRAGRRPA
jgi:hypothetical protein